MEELSKEIKSDNAEQDRGTVFFRWKFDEFNRVQRTKVWYVGMAIVCVLLIGYALLTKNILFALFILLSIFVILMFNTNNRRIECMITEDGVGVGDKFYRYDQLKNFYIIYQPPEVKKLYFEIKNILSPRIPIDLQDQNPVKIREVLLKYIEEDLEREHEPLSEVFGRIFKL